MTVEWSKTFDGDEKIDGRYQRFQKSLGKGSFKTVYEAFDKQEQKDVAWNVVDLVQVRSESEMVKIKKETDILKSLNHDNILRIHDTWLNEQKDKLVFITDIMRDGSLMEYILNRDITLGRVKEFCKEILNALQYLHYGVGKPVIHRDLKCDNIFIDASINRIVLGDLGLSTSVGSCKTNTGQSVVGTPEFMAPEMFEEKYDEKVDIYAFGMCVVQMVTKKYPYQECRTLHQVYKKITKREMPAVLKSITSKTVRDFILICIQFEHEQRPTAGMLRLHPFLNFTYPIDQLSCSDKNIVSESGQLPSNGIPENKPVNNPNIQKKPRLSRIEEHDPSRLTGPAVRSPTPDALRVQPSKRQLSSTGAIDIQPSEEVDRPTVDRKASQHFTPHYSSKATPPSQPSDRKAEIIKAEEHEDGQLRIFLKVVCEMKGHLDRRSNLTMKSVSFDYKHGEDTPRSIAEEMVEDLVLKPKEEMLKAIEEALSLENINNIKTNVPSSMVSLNGPMINSTNKSADFRQPGVVMPRHNPTSTEGHSTWSLQSPANFNNSHIDSCVTQQRKSPNGSPIRIERLSNDSEDSFINTTPLISSPHVDHSKSGHHDSPNINKNKSTNRVHGGPLVQNGTSITELNNGDIGRGVMPGQVGHVQQAEMINGSSRDQHHLLKKLSAPYSNGHSYSPPHNPMEGSTQPGPLTAVDLQGEKYPSSSHEPNHNLNGSLVHGQRGEGIQGPAIDLAAVESSSSFISYQQLSPLNINNPNYNSSRANRQLLTSPPAQAASVAQPKRGNWSVHTNSVSPVSAVKSTGQNYRSTSNHAGGHEAVSNKARSPPGENANIQRSHSARPNQAMHQPRTSGNHLISTNILTHSSNSAGARLTSQHLKSSPSKINGYVRSSASNSSAVTPEGYSMHRGMEKKTVEVITTNGLHVPGAPGENYDAINRVVEVIAPKMDRQGEDGTAMLTGPAPCRNSSVRVELPISPSKKKEKAQGHVLNGHKTMGVPSQSDAGAWRIPPASLGTPKLKRTLSREKKEQDSDGSGRTLRQKRTPSSKQSKKKKIMQLVNEEKMKLKDASLVGKDAERPKPCVGSLSKSLVKVNAPASAYDGSTLSPKTRGSSGSSKGFKIERLSDDSLVGEPFSPHVSNNSHLAVPGRSKPPGIEEDRGEVKLDESHRNLPRNGKKNHPEQEMKLMDPIISTNNGRKLLPRDYRLADETEPSFVPSTENSPDILIDRKIEPAGPDSPNSVDGQQRVIPYHHNIDIDQDGTVILSGDESQGGTTTPGGQSAFLLEKQSLSTDNVVDFNSRAKQHLDNINKKLTEKRRKVMNEYRARLDEIDEFMDIRYNDLKKKTRDQELQNRIDDLMSNFKQQFKEMKSQSKDFEETCGLVMPPSLGSGC